MAMNPGDAIDDECLKSAAVGNPPSEAENTDNALAGEPFGEWPTWPEAASLRQRQRGSRDHGETGRRKSIEKHTKGPAKPIRFDHRPHAD